MLIPLGFLAGSGGGVDTDFELISTTILGTATSSVTFSSLGTYSSTYKHLQLRLVPRMTSAFTERTIYLRFNSDSGGSSYASHALDGNGSSVSSSEFTSRSDIALTSTPAASATASVFAAIVVDILDPYSTSKNKTTKILGGVTTTPQIALRSGVYLNTASITSITISENFSSSNFATGSRFSLYGIKG